VSSSRTMTLRANGAGTFTLRRCEVAHNSEALNIQGGQSGDVLIEACAFHGNYNAKGAVEISKGVATEGTVTIRNCTSDGSWMAYIHGNTAVSVTIVNCAHKTFSSGWSIIYYPDTGLTLDGGCNVMTYNNAGANYTLQGGDVVAAPGIDATSWTRPSWTARRPIATGGRSWSAASAPSGRTRTGRAGSWP